LSSRVRMSGGDRCESYCDRPEDCRGAARGQRRRPQALAPSAIEGRRLRRVALARAEDSFQASLRGDAALDVLELVAERSPTLPGVVCGGWRLEHLLHFGLMIGELLRFERQVGELALDQLTSATRCVMRCSSILSRATVSWTRGVTVAACSIAIRSARTSPSSTVMGSEVPPCAAA